MQSTKSLAIFARDLAGHTWLKQKEEKLPSRAYALRVIKQQLWCCCGSDGIVIYDSDLQKQRTIPSGDMVGVFDVAEMSSGDLVIAADYGLYHTDASGQ